MVDFQWIGKPVPRKDALIKATGSAKFTNDIVLSNMLHGRILRSPYPHARIRNIDTDKARRLLGVKAVITGRDVPDRQYGVTPARYDEFVLAKDKVRYVGDEVVAVAAVDVRQPRKLWNSSRWTTRNCRPCSMRTRRWKTERPLCMNATRTT